ncbi:hypothetical protein BH10PSE19_BH10PSE19_21030 [soil metagenome]
MKQVSMKVNHKTTLETIQKQICSYAKDAITPDRVRIIFQDRQLGDGPIPQDILECLAKNKGLDHFHCLFRAPIPQPSQSRCSVM